MDTDKLSIILLYYDGFISCNRIFKSFQFSQNDKIYAFAKKTE